MKVLYLFCVVATALASRRTCGMNQLYKKCGSPCPLTCDNYVSRVKFFPAMYAPYVSPLKFFPAMCVPGCHCEEGFVKSRDGRCIRPEDCPARKNQVCGENKLYTVCGSACPLTCDNYNNPPKICPAMCVPGCHCEKGYVKSSEGRCIRPADCSTKTHVVQTCLEEPEKGKCLAYMSRWYYKADEGKCYKFIYGGCQGNGNRYYTEEECLEHCGTRHVRASCQEEKIVGPCKGALKRFFFDKVTGKCEQFAYGGCSGNSNNFQSLGECQAICSA